MSLVIAIKDGNRFVFGADKQASVSNSKSHTATKIWMLDNYEGCCMGGVGVLRGNQILQYANDLLDKNYFQSEEGPDSAYIALTLTQTIWGLLDLQGIKCISKDESGYEAKYLPGEYLFAYKDKCWAIHGDMSITEVDDFIAIGSGAELATGSLIESERTKLNPFERIVHAIDAAAEETLYVDHQIDFLVTLPKKADFVNRLDALGYDKESIKAVTDSLGITKPTAKINKEAIAEEVESEEADQSTEKTVKNKKKSNKSKKTTKETN